MGTLNARYGVGSSTPWIWIAPRPTRLMAARTSSSGGATNTPTRRVNGGRPSQSVAASATPTARGLPGHNTTPTASTSR